MICYVNTFESVVFESPPERDCPFCVTEEDRIRWVAEDKKKEEDKKAAEELEEKKKIEEESTKKDEQPNE